MDSRSNLRNRRLHCVPWLPALLVALLGLCFAETRVDGASRPRFAQAGEIGCSLTLLTKNGTITAGEPLIARMEIHNEPNQEIGVWPGGTFLDVYDGHGELVAAMSRPRLDVVDFAYTFRDLAPSETYSTFLIVTGLYQFRTPGRYTVRVQQLGLPRELPVVCEDAASIQVLPYNADQLEAACDELFAPTRNVPIQKQKPSSFGAGMGPRKALLSVRDDVVLPYLDYMARKSGDRYACRAIRRIGTPRAENLLAALAARTDRVGTAARQALEMSLEPTAWDVRAE